MNGLDVVREVSERKEPRHQFIKWWRKENDFIDVELIDTFREGVKSGDEIGGFELLDMDELWGIVSRLCPGRVSRRAFDDHEELLWDRVGSDGVKRNYKCTYAPEFLLQIFDVETKGNYVE